MDDYDEREEIDDTVLNYRGEDILDVLTVFAKTIKHLRISEKDNKALRQMLEVERGLKESYKKRLAELNQSLSEKEKSDAKDVLEKIMGFEES